MLYHVTMSEFERGPDTTQVMVTGEQAVAPRAPRRRDRCTMTMVTGPDPGSMLMLHEEEAVLGRVGESVHRIEDRGLSRRHARIYRMHGEFWIEDLRSTNGTFVNGELLTRPSMLYDGDRVQMGQDVLFRFQLHDALEQAAARKLYESAVRDGLTGLHNRRYLDERLAQEFAYAARHGAALSTILLDLDHFKSVNDTFGHAVGDRVLELTAGVMQRTVRTEDLVARYGGEEFCVLVRGVAIPGVMTLAERLRVQVEELAVPTGDGRTLKVTSSFGVATLDAEHPVEDVASLLRMSDDALYRAKAAGRNRCLHYDL